MFSYKQYLSPLSLKYMECGKSSISVCSDDQNNHIHAVQFMILSTFDIYTVAVLLFVFNSAFKIKGIYLTF